MPNPDPRLAAIHASQGTRLRSPSGVAISPDSALVAWGIGGREGVTLHLTDPANPDPAKDKIISPNSDTNCSNSSPVWSPDSQWLAFTSTCTGKEDKPGQAQIFLWSRATGEVKQLTHVTGSFSRRPCRRMASRCLPLRRKRHPLRRRTRRDEAVVRRHRRRRRRGPARLRRRRSASGAGVFVTPADLHVYEFAWSPTAPQIAFIAAHPPAKTTGGSPSSTPQSHNRTRHRSSSTPSPPRPPCTASRSPSPASPPTASSIAFIGGLMSDQGSTGGDVWVVDAKGGDPIDITPDIDGTPTCEAWLGNDTVGFVEDRRGHTLLADYDVATRKPDRQRHRSRRSHHLRRPHQGRRRRLRTPASSPSSKSGHATAPEIWLAGQRRRPQADHPPQRRRQTPRPHRVHRVGRTKASTSRAGSPTPKTTTPQRSIR